MKLKKVGLWGYNSDAGNYRGNFLTSFYPPVSSKIVPNFIRLGEIHIQNVKTQILRQQKVEKGDKTVEISLIVNNLRDPSWAQSRD